MARLIERTFDPTKSTIVRRFFVGAGRHYNPGEVFDWRRLSVDQRRVRLLFEAGKLMHPDGATPPVEEPLIEVGAVGAVLPTIAQEMQDEDIHHVAVTTTPVYDAETPVVDDLDGLNMRELRAIAEAEGATTRLRRDDQRQAIRDHRAQAGQG
jgi:hypothetical protein